MVTADAPNFSNGFYQDDLTDGCRPYFLSWAESIGGLSGELCQSIQRRLIRMFGDKSIRLASALPKASDESKYFLYRALKEKENGSREMDTHAWRWHETFKFVYVLSEKRDTEERMKMMFDSFAQKHGDVTAEDMNSLLQSVMREIFPTE